MEKTTAAIGAGGGVLTVILSFFDTYAAGIGAMCTVLTVCIYAYVSLFKSNKKDAREFKKWKAEVRDKLAKLTKDD